MFPEEEILARFPDDCNQSMRAVKHKQALNCFMRGVAEARM
jgi:hypothetical protein